MKPYEVHITVPEERFALGLNRHTGHKVITIVMPSGEEQVQSSGVIYAPDDASAVSFVERLVGPISTIVSRAKIERQPSFHGHALAPGQLPELYREIHIDLRNDLVKAQLAGKSSYRDWLISHNKRKSYSAITARWSDPSMDGVMLGEAQRLGEFLRDSNPLIEAVIYDTNQGMDNNWLRTGKLEDNL